MFDLFGAPVMASTEPTQPQRAYRYRVLCVWLSSGGELLGQVSRPLSHNAAKRLWYRVLRGDSDVLDAWLFNADEPIPLPPGVRLLDALDARPEAIRIDRTDLFE